MPAFSRAVAQSRCRLVTRAAESRSCGSSRATAHGAARARRGVAALGGGVLRDWLCRLPQAQRDDAPLRYQPRRSPGPGVAPMAGGRRRGGPRAASSAAAPSPTAPRRPPRGPGPGGRGPGPPGCRAVTCFGPGSRRIIARPRGRRRGGASAGSVDAAAVAACWQARVVRRPWHGRPGPGTQRVSLPLPTSQSESPRRRVDPSRSKSDPADRRTAVSHSTPPLTRGGEADSWQSREEEGGGSGGGGGGGSGGDDGESLPAALALHRRRGAAVAERSGHWCNSNCNWHLRAFRVGIARRFAPGGGGGRAPGAEGVGGRGRRPGGLRRRS